MMSAYLWHSEATASIAAPMEAVFAFMDNPAHLGAHMGRRSAAMGGMSMRTETDDRQGQAVGSVIRMSGRLLGLSLRLEEAVVERTPPSSKAWETLGEPRLLVIGRYRMGFDVAPDNRGSLLRVWIDYDLPASGVPRGLGRLLGRIYAGWCVRQMAQEAARTLQQDRL